MRKTGRRLAAVFRWNKDDCELRDFGDAMHSEHRLQITEKKSTTQTRNTSRIQPIVLFLNT
jgi:hypothetical protein